MQVKKVILTLFSVITLCLAVSPFIGGSRRAHAQPLQSSTDWSPRQRIPGIDDLADTPNLVADGTGTIHSFHVQPVAAGESEWAIVYSSWTPVLGWTEPTAIFLPMSGELIRVPKVFLANDGIIHLVFYCCDDSNPDIYYSWAPLANAADAQAWAPPELIGPNAENPASVAILADDHDELHVIYGGGPLGKGIYEVRSAEGGPSWSDPIPVFLTRDQTLLPFDPKLVKDAEGNLHAVWTVNRPDGNGDAIYYASIAHDQTSWAAPILLAEADGEVVPTVTSPAIAAHDGELIVIYLEWSPPERLIRISSDGGFTWSEPNSFLPPTRGEYGPAVFAIDGKDTLHVMMGDRGRGLTLWHSSKEGGRWREPEPVVPVGESERYPVGHPLEFHPTWPQMVISRGNLMFVSWALDPGHGNNGTWFAFRKLESLELPLAAPRYSTVTIVGDDASSSPTTSTVAGTITAGSVTEPGAGNVVVVAGENSRLGLLIFAVLPTCVILIAVILGRELRTRRR